MFSHGKLIGLLALLDLLFSLFVPLLLPLFSIQLLVTPKYMKLSDKFTLTPVG